MTEISFTDREGFVWAWTDYTFDPPVLMAYSPDDEDRAWDVPADTPKTVENLEKAVAAFFAEYGGA